MENYSYFYLHGFASSPLSKKDQYFAEFFRQKSLNLNIVDLNNNDFTNLTLSRQIAQVSRHFEDKAEKSVRIIGSSFGGLTGAWLGEKYPQVESLVLLAPAFNFDDYWRSHLDDQKLKNWQKSNYLSVYHYGEKKELPLHYQFLEDLRTYQNSQLQKTIPTLILHGIKDDVISVTASREYSQNRPWVKLKELDSDHSLTDVLPIIWQEITKFWHI